MVRIAHRLKGSQAFSIQLSHPNQTSCRIIIHVLIAEIIAGLEAIAILNLQ